MQRPADARIGAPHQQHLDGAAEVAAAHRLAGAGAAGERQRLARVRQQRCQKEEIAFGLGPQQRRAAEVVPRQRGAAGRIVRHDVRPGHRPPAGAARLRPDLEAVGGRVERERRQQGIGAGALVDVGGPVEAERDQARGAAAEGHATAVAGHTPHDGRSRASRRSGAALEGGDRRRRLDHSAARLPSSSDSLSGASSRPPGCRSTRTDPA